MPLWGWAGSATSGSATRTVGPHPGEHPRPAVVLSPGATAMEIRCTKISGFVDFCSLSVHSQRQRPCSENASQCCCASGLSRFASSIGELRRRAGRSMHSSRASCRKRVFRPPVSSSLPSSKMQSNLPEWSDGRKPKVAPRAKGQHPLRLRQCEPDLVLTGLTRLLQIGTDFMDGRAIVLHYYY